jgi:hypothetical protein
MHRSHHAESSSWQPLPLAIRAIGLALLAFQPLALAQGQDATEDQVKAAYLLNFARLAEWPSSVLPEGTSPLVIGVSGGDEEFLHVLQVVVQGKLAGTHSLMVKTASSKEEMRSCYIVFFRASERKHVAAAIAGLAQAGVLLVGEDELFLRQGGMVNLVRENMEASVLKSIPMPWTIRKYTSALKFWRWPGPAMGLPPLLPRIRRVKALGGWRAAILPNTQKSPSA